MKKYKIGNRIITCDSPVKAMELAKLMDSMKDNYKTDPTKLKSGQKIIENGRVVTILSIVGNVTSGYHAKVQYDDGSTDKWYFTPNETITVVDSMKDADYSYLTEEEQKAVDDYRQAIQSTQNPEVLEIFQHILQEELDHIEELKKAREMDQ